MPVGRGSGAASRSGGGGGRGGAASRSGGGGDSGRMVDWRTVPPLARVLSRAIDWRPLLAMTPLLPALASLYAVRDLPPDLALAMVRANGLLLGAAAALALADDTATTTEAVPSPRWLRQWLRTLLGLGYAALAWGTGYLVIAWHSPVSLPVAETALVAGAGATLILAVSGLAVRRAPGQLGAAAGGAVAAPLFVASLALPSQWTIWPGLGDPRWSTVHTSWWLALAAGLLLLLIAHRDTRAHRCGRL